MLQLDDFAEKVALSGLVPTAELTQARQVEPAPAGDASVRLARLLVQQGFLTTYQARKLLAGATRGFFPGGYRILSPAVDGRRRWRRGAASARWLIVALTPPELK
jgi:eukaryotic-like serine/threonine-protein kinase